MNLEISVYKQGIMHKILVFKKLGTARFYDDNQSWVSWRNIVTMSKDSWNMQASSKKFKTSAKFVDFFYFNFCQRIIDFYEYENLLSLFFIKDFMKSTFHIDSYCRLTSHSVEKHENLSYRKNISWNQLFSNLFCITVAFTKFLSKKYAREFP